SYCTIYALISLSFSVSCSRAHRDLHSFPTRRSSDLGSFGGVVVQTMKLSVLNGLFASFELGRDSGIYIFLNDGRIVTGYPYTPRSEEHTSELQSRENLVCRLLLEKKKTKNMITRQTR